MMTSTLTNLARLRVEDPAAAAAVVDALWEQLAREDPRLFHALWRRANRPSRRPAQAQLPKIEWLDDLPPMRVVAQRLPSVNLSPLPARAPVPLPPTPALRPAQLEPSAHIVFV